MSTFGWQAFTVEASYKSYDKSLKKLPTASTIAAPAAILTDDNALGYGTLNAKVSKHALDRYVHNISIFIVQSINFIPSYAAD